MSKSLDFCKMVASDKARSTYYDRPWDDAKEVDSWEIFKQYLGDKHEFELTGKTDDGQTVTVAIILKQDPDADVTYFTSESATHDGTLLFVQLLFERIVHKICTAGTYDKTVGLPKRYIKYTIGNFVLLNEYGDFGAEEKPWLYERTTVLLPIKYETFDETDSCRGHKARMVDFI